MGVAIFPRLNREALIRFGPPRPTVGTGHAWHRRVVEEAVASILVWFGWSQGKEIMSEYANRSNQHIVQAFDNILQEIARKVAEMGGLAEKQITDAVRALVEHDTELAERVVPADPTLDTMQRPKDIAGQSQYRARLAQQIYASSQPSA
jgi:hypothetical protein